MTAFIHSIQSEWLKKKRSMASWLVLAGGLLVPLILTIARMARHDKIAQQNALPHFWDAWLDTGWQVMAMFLLPMGVILATSLVTQLEFRNNTWKQVLTSPQRITAVFFAKLTVILVMLIECFLLFNAGLYLSGVLPGLLFGAGVPQQSFPWQEYLERSAFFFIDVLPVVALQYLLSLQFKNFMVPVGGGICFFVAALIGLSWKYNYTIPYAYVSLDFVHNVHNEPSGSLHAWAMIYFLIFMTGAYLLFLLKKEKG